jgi:hypothetical protein
MRGRPLRGFFGGLFLGIFVDVDLVFGGVVKLSSVLLTILPIALLVIGLLLGIWSPVGRSRLPTMAMTSGSIPPAAPPTVTTIPASSSPSSATPPGPVPPPTPPPAAAPPPAVPPPEETPPI